MSKLKNRHFQVNLMWIYVISAPIFIGILALEHNSHLTQMLIITFAVILYILFALMHHYLDKSLKIEIVLEYILIASLALIILQSI